MKKLILLAFLLPIICFAAPFQAILFDDDAQALAFVVSLESRIQHDPVWTYADHASPSVILPTGKHAVVIVDRIKPYLTTEELAQIVTVDN
jgi:hypothetical protein